MFSRASEQNSEFPNGQQSWFLCSSDRIQSISPRTKQRWCCFGVHADFQSVNCLHSDRACDTEYINAACKHAKALINVIGH